MVGDGLGRGTTPACTFRLPFSTDSIAEVWIIFSQKGREVFTKDTDDCILAGDTITCRLSQSDTLSLDAKAKLEIQVCVLFGGDTPSRSNSNIIETTVNRVLKEGEMNV